jgi:hypothetical protein
LHTLQATSTPYESLEIEQIKIGSNPDIDIPFRIINLGAAVESVGLFGVCLSMLFLYD